MDDVNFDFTGESLSAPKYTRDEVHELGVKLAKKREEISILEDQLSILKSDKEAIQQELLIGLKGHNLKNFPIPGVGNVIRKERMMVTMPKDIVRRKLVLDAFIKFGWGDDITINSQTLNSKFNSKVEELELLGATIELDKIIDGIETPKMRETIEIRKGK